MEKYKEKLLNSLKKHINIVREKILEKVLKEIPREKYENIFKGAYERPEKYVSKNKTRKNKKQYK